MQEGIRMTSTFNYAGFMYSKLGDIGFLNLSIPWIIQGEILFHNKFNYVTINF